MHYITGYTNKDILSDVQLLVQGIQFKAIEHTLTCSAHTKSQLSCHFW